MHPRAGILDSFLDNLVKLRRWRCVGIAEAEIKDIFGPVGAFIFAPSSNIFRIQEDFSANMRILSEIAIVSP